MPVNSRPITPSPPAPKASDHHAGDDGRRRQHDADLKGGRGEFVVVIARHRDVARLPRTSWLAPSVPCGRPFLRVGFVARHGRLPGLDLLRHRRLGVLVDRAAATCSVIASAAVRSEVWRMVLAWKKFQVSDALMLSSMPTVCALLPSVSENARNSAITAISSAIFLLLLETSPCAFGRARRVLLHARSDARPHADRMHAMAHVALL